MSLTARDIAEITRLLEDSSFDELHLEIDGLKIHLRRSGAVPPSARGGSRDRNRAAAPRTSRHRPRARCRPPRKCRMIPHSSRCARRC